MISDDFDWWLLIGYETALPSIGRRVEGMAAGLHAITLVAVAGAAEEQVFNTRADNKQSGSIAFPTRPPVPNRWWTR